MKDREVNFLNTFRTHPRRIFLVDALGALLSAILLFGVLAQFEHYFGMPRKVLYILSVLAFCLFGYSISCYQFIKTNRKPFLKVIIACNIVYSLISIGLIVEYFDKITELGFIYFVLELIVIGVIVFVEYRTLQKIQFS
ncbi:hypothetical protein [Aquimarina algicola]|uniref:Uncharacterized protein n=1 Tax=Aquimarina algicola TaxID=2589995 RepID=A0A504JAP8_9FLAO|nr:hypothetical protein [Aquimarina algicola]TPN88026.1 hypothetical protein FHK87_10670 [Aquimarina algicola]